MKAVFDYVDAPGGSGKTYALANRAIQLVRQGETVLIIQPTILLIRETAEAYFENTLHRVINSENSDGGTIETIQEYLKQPITEPHILLITWAAFVNLPYFHDKSSWHVFVDEVPQVYELFDEPASISHGTVTAYLDYTQIGIRYGLVYPTDQAQMRKVAESSKQDTAIKTYAILARKMIDGKWQSFVDMKRFDDLRSGHNRQLTIYHILQPTILMGFASVMIFGARFQETMLYKIWSKKDVKFNAAVDIGLRYTEHNNGELLTIHYGFAADWSKEKRGKVNSDVIKAYVDAVEKVLVSDKTLWIANKDIIHSPFSEPGSSTKHTRLPNFPHGINIYQYEYDNIVSLSALNPPKHMFNFMNWLNISADELRTSTYNHVVYQSILRCSIRDQSNRNPKRVFVPDLKLAKWLQVIFQGSIVVPLDIPSDVMKMKKPGRAKIYASDADRLRAYRAKKKIAEKDKHAEFLDQVEVTSAHLANTSGPQPITGFF